MTFPDVLTGPAVELEVVALHTSNLPCTVDVVQLPQQRNLGAALSLADHLAREPALHEGALGTARIKELQRRFMTEDHLSRFVEPAGDALVFTSSNGKPLRLSNFRNRVWRPAVMQTGLPEDLRIHDLRHTAASLPISHNVHPRIVQEHLGHSSIAITMDRYGHLYPEDRLPVAKVLDSVYSEAVG